MFRFAHPAWLAALPLAAVATFWGNQSIYPDHIGEARQIPGSGKVLFTGYYEPVLSCRINADDVYRYPLYRRPDDIVEIDLSLFGAVVRSERAIVRIVANR